MKKLFRTYALLAAAVVAVALLSVSCIKDSDLTAGEKASVTMTFTTRVSDNVTAGNLLGNEQMRKLRVIVARSGTNDIIYNVSYDIQPGEKQKVIHFSELTVNKDGENFDFYAIANEDAFLTGGESLEVSLSALKSRILTKDFNSPALSKIPQAAFMTIKVGPSENTSATMNLLFPLAKVVLNFDNQTGESVDLTNVAISGIADRGYLFKDIYADSYPQGTAGSGTVKFGNEGTLQVPVGEVADADASPYIRYLYPWTSGNAYKLTATWGSKTHEVVFKIGDEELKKLEAGQQLNVNVSLIANSLKVSLTVSDWTVDDQILDFSTKFNGLLNPASAGSVKLTADKGAVAVATDNDGTQREATFSFKMFSPVGVRWTAHLENTSEFELTGTTSGYGAKDAVDVTFGVKPKFEHVATDAKSVKLYITVEQPFGGAGSDGIQVINPEENGVYRFPGTSTEILIQQVSESEFDGLTGSVSIKQ